MSNIPALRFPEFTDEWSTHRMSKFLTRYSENNRDQEFNVDDILSLSSVHGIVNRKELLEDTYSGVNHLNYKKTRLNDLVYGKSITANFPFGLFKVNDYKDGLLSTLYFTFKVKEDVSPKYLDVYFSYPNRANKFLRKYVLVGDRYITADADYLLSGQINLPALPEQHKIASFFSSIDDWIENLKQQKSSFEKYKKGVIQKIFSQQIRFQDNHGKKFPDWEERKLNEVLSEHKLKSSGVEPVFSVSVHKGLINQIEHLGRSFAAKSTSHYNLVKPHDLVYTKSPTGDFPLGIIKQSRLNKNVIVSPLYGVFTPESPGLGYMLHVYFESSINTSNYLNSLVKKGAKNTINITNDTFLSKRLLLPTSVEEQNKIANFLSFIDKRTELLNTKISNANQWKKGLMQQMFI